MDFSVLRTHEILVSTDRDKLKEKRILFDQITCVKKNPFFALFSYDWLYYRVNRKGMKKLL